MEYSYHRELKHNYLIIKNSEEESDKNTLYQLKILENRKLTGFVPCDLRNINNESFLYYEINSMQSIKDCFAVRKMSYEDLVRLLEAVKRTIDGLSEYLLGMENVILDGRSIFMDLSSDEFKFMYYPFAHENKSLGAFADELFDLVDQEDQKAIEMIYDFCDQAQNEGVLVLECIEHLLEKNTVSKPVEEPHIVETFSESFEEESEEKEDHIVKNQKNNVKIQMIFAVLFLGVVASMVYIRGNYILNKEENILSIIVLVVSMLTGLTAFFTGIKELLQKKDSLSERDYESKEADKNEWLEDECNIEESIDMKTYQNTLKVTSGVTKERGYGETMVLNDDTEKALTLYSRNTDKTVRISLDCLPIVLGKMEGCVDKVINDASISRIHCRFSQNEKGNIVITDLNSTNGTYRNGLKIKPQIEQEIEEGDELRIGRICFDCR